MREPHHVVTEDYDHYASRKIAERREREKGFMILGVIVLVAFFLLYLFGSFKSPVQQPQVTPSQQPAPTQLTTTQQEEAQRGLLLEQGRQQVEQDFKVKLAKITNGMTIAQAEEILGLKANLCQHRATIPTGENECSYSSVIQDKYRVTFTIFYIDDGSYVMQGFSVTTI